MAHEKFQKGDGVRVSEPDNPFYSRTGVVVDKVDTDETRERPHTYYRVDMDGAGDMRLCFRDHHLTQI